MGWRLCSRHLVLVLLIAVQAPTASSEKSGAEVEVLNLRSASFEVESGEAQRRRAQEEEVEAVGVEVKSVTKEEGEVEEAEGKESEGEGGEGESEEEEETDPVDLTIGICLLGFVTLIMTIYSWANHEDADMKYYVWHVISSTLSIFLAVLMFTTLNEVAHHYGPARQEGTGTDWIHIFIDLLELVALYAAMQTSVALISGAFEKMPFLTQAQQRAAIDMQQGRSCCTAVPKLLSIKEQKEKREQTFKSIATLLAHMSGFAAINFGGGIQQMESIKAHQTLLYSVPLFLFVMLVVICRMVRRVRTHFSKKILASSAQQNYELLNGKETEDGDDWKEVNGSPGIEWCLEKWDEETYDAENEMSSLNISFLLMQAIRYNLTGSLPDAIGIEEEHFHHSQPNVQRLGAVGVAFATASCLVVWMATVYFPDNVKIPGGTLKSFLRRITLVSQGTFAMGFAWSLMYTSKWQVTLMLPDMNPNCVKSRVILALIITVLCFFIILFLDRLADMKSTGETVDRAIITIISALSILVGFSWEQSFDGAVEVLSETCFQDHPVMANMTLTVCIFVIVYPQWSRRILKKELELLKARSDAEQEEAIHDPCG